MLSLILFSLETEEQQTKFEKIYNEHGKRMMNIAYGITKDQYDAEDAMNTSLFIIAKNIDRIRFDSPEMLKSYVYKIVKNAAIKIAQKKNKEQPILNIDDYLLLGNDDLAEKIVDNIQYNELINKIQGVSGVYKDVLVLYYVHNFSISEISDLLQREKSTVKKQLYRGRKLIKDFLETK